MNGGFSFLSAHERPLTLKAPPPDFVPQFPLFFSRSTATESDASAALPRDAPAPYDHSELRNEFELRSTEIIDLAWRTLRRLGVDVDAVPDAVQDALLVLHRRRAEFRGQSSYQTWVYGVLLRVASDYRRKQRRKAAVFAVTEDGGVHFAASDTPSPFEQLEKRAAAELLHQLLDQLPADVREVFVLVELEELSLSEAAAALTLRESTCKSRLRIARRLFNAAVARERAKHQHKAGGLP